MTNNTKVWWAGLLAAFLSGGSGAASAALGGMVLAPQSFNLHDGKANILQMAIIGFLFPGFLGVLHRLQQSPLPSRWMQEIQTETTTAKIDSPLGAVGQIETVATKTITKETSTL